MPDTSAPEGPDANGDDGSTDVRRWSNRLALSTDDDSARGGGTPRPTPGESEPSRNPERDWGAVLVAAGMVVVMLAAGVSISVLLGGLLGLLTVRGATVLTLVLVVVGSAGLFQGWRVYHGR